MIRLFGWICTLPALERTKPTAGFSHTSSGDGERSGVDRCNGHTGALPRTHPSISD